MLIQSEYESNLGLITLLADQTNLLGLWFKDQKYFGSNYDLTKIKKGENHPIKLAKKWLNLYFLGYNPNPKIVPINYETTKFRKLVYDALKDIPYGQTVTYKELSNLIQKDKKIKVNKSRAVGNAIGHNPILLIIPCHRVVGTNNRLVGYAAGAEVKQKLLDIESKTIKE